tara:strand:+ start:2741 stop:3112 length:372 start_codon:yes stop_codon:yes gene_type:complete
MVLLLASKALSVPLRDAFAPGRRRGCAGAYATQQNPPIQVRAQTVARGNEGCELSKRFEAPADGVGTTPSGTEPTPAPLRAASAGALRLPRATKSRVHMKAGFQGHVHVMHMIVACNHTTEIE